MTRDKEKLEYTVRSVVEVPQFISLLVLLISAGERHGFFQNCFLSLGGPKEELVTKSSARAFLRMTPKNYPGTVCEVELQHPSVAVPSPTT